jgi:hypothetical protein
MSLEETLILVRLVGPTQMSEAVPRDGRIYLKHAYVIGLPRSDLPHDDKSIDTT